MRRIFAVPAALFLASAAGLAAALVGDGPWDVLGWLGIAAPLGAIAWAWARRRRER
jgi:hypothetical protein